MGMVEGGGAKGVEVYTWGGCTVHLIKGDDHDEISAGR